MVLGLSSFNPLGGTSSGNAANLTGGGGARVSGKVLQPSLKLDDPLLDTLKFQQDHSLNNSNSSRLVLSNRILHPTTLSSAEEVSYKVSVPNFADLTPLKLGSKYITDLIKIDSMTPSDIYSHSHISKDGGLDNYYFDYEKGLGDFARFEKISSLRLPDKFFDEYNSTECVSKMGLFPEIERSWMAVDNKLILWNYDLQLLFSVPGSGSGSGSGSDSGSGSGSGSNSGGINPFLVIDESQIKHTILQVKLVKPKANVFVANVNQLLVVATTMEILIFIVNFDKAINKLEIFNPELSVSTQGLIVNNIIENPKTGDIYFTGEADGINIWRLDYSNKSTFTKNKCDKVCMTKSGFTSVLPYKMQSQVHSGGNNGINHSNSTGNNSTNGGAIPEHITALDLDPSRNTLYSLSNKSVLRVYELSTNQEHFTKSNQLTPNEIFKGISSLFNDAATSTSIESFSKFRIMSIQHISLEESANIQLIAITNYGCRILLRLGNASSFPSFASFATSSSSALKLSVSSIKFPPSKESPKLNPELDSFTRDKQYHSQLIINQRKSQLLKNTKFAKILSPGVFLCVKRTKFSDKFFICTSNYGFLKKNGKLVEDAEFVSIGGDSNDGTNTYIHDIIQLTPSMNATETPTGYANVLATQYIKKPLKFAVLTNFGIHVYQFRTADQILNSLGEETLENFMEENGFEETCSSLLYLSCSYGNHNNDILKRKAQSLFATCGNNARLQQHQQQPNTQSSGLLQQVIPSHQQQSSQHPTIDQVILSDRFYGTCLLISRLFRNYWNTKVFTPLPHIKHISQSPLQIDLSSIKEDNLLIQGLNIDKRQVEFFIGSVMVLIDFFIENGNSVQGLNAPNYSSDPTRFGNEICLRGEHIAFTSILKSLNSIKEALSFVMFLIEETQINKSNFNDILKFLSVPNQINLLSLNFKDLLLPNTEVKNLIKDLLSSIVNKSILKGGSIDLIATSLQGRCGSFCSTNDVFIFKAIENLTRAKSVGGRDNDLKIKCLNNAVLLFEEAYESLTLENIQNSVNIMVELEFFSGAVRMCLSLAHKLTVTKSSTKPGATTAITTPNESFGLDILKNDAKPTLILQLYEIIFTILSKIDLKTIQITETNDQLLINDFIEIRDSTYETCFASKNKAFHYEFYQWFINQGVSERLLSINTPFILPFLEEKSQNNLELTDLLWLYHAKRESYFAAANILYSLAILEFNLKLQQRIEYLSRANGFCNCVCPPNVRQKMIQLSSVVGELFEVANVQLDILSAISQDDRISKDNKQLAIQELNYKILNLSELFNSYTDPLGYYDLCLYIFKISDYKNTEDILKRWELCFEKLFHDFLIPSKKALSIKEPFYITLSTAIICIGVKLSNNDLVFPAEELIKLICKYIQDAEEEQDLDGSTLQQQPPVGLIVDIFIKSGVSFDKLYNVMKSMINYYSFDSISKKSLDIVSGEMCYLIKNWYSNDKKLREIIPGDKIKNLNEYTSSNDPINEYLKLSGIPV